MAKRIVSIALREGFFHSKDEPELPKACGSTSTWKGRKAFLTALGRVEASSMVHEKHYKGDSKCRCCGTKNGSAENSLRYFGMMWIWPGGFRHYVELHNLRPSLAFQEFILAAAADLEAAKSKGR